MLRSREDMESRLAKIRAKEKAQRVKYLKGDQSSKKRKTENDNGEEGEEQFVLDDYESDREQNGSRSGSTNGLSAKTLELMSQIGMGPAVLKDEDDEVEDETKAIIHRLARSISNISRSSTAHEPIHNSLNLSTSFDESTFRHPSQASLPMLLPRKT